MILKDISFNTPQENILYDEVLLHLADKEEAGAFLRFWESPKTFIVLGRICKEEEDLKRDNIKQDNIPVLRRASGGGTVLQGQGCLNYSVVISKHSQKELSDIGKSYQIILQKVVNALSILGVKTQFWPISDIAMAGSNKKFSGNAQKRARNYILHHGTILYNFDLSLIEKYLQIPRSVPEYRQGRTHLDFVDNITLRPQNIKQQLIKEFDVHSEDSAVSETEQFLLSKFLTERAASLVLQKIKGNY